MTNRNKKKDQNRRETTAERGEMEELDDIQAIRKDISQLLEQQNIITKQQEQIDSLLKQIVNLQKVNREQEKKISQLNTRIDDLEQYTQADNVIISGLSTMPVSYADASSDTAERDAEQEPALASW